MSFWLATLNPGKKSRRGRRRRKLSAWQRAVKKHGGVMQAVRARRAAKRGRGRKRRNPFLTAGAARVATVAANAVRRRRKHSKRGSAVLRRSLRGRSRRTARRYQMARKTRRSRRRRTPPRGRGGRFLSRRSRGRRRTRRNPLLGLAANPRRRRRRRARRNPLFLSRRGFSGRRHRGFRQMHRRRRRPHYWHNSVLPVSWNPRRRKSHRRRYRRNSVLPVSWNPAALAIGGRGGVMAATVGRLKTFVDVKFWTETGIPAATGFFGSKAIGGMIVTQVNKVEAISKMIPSAAAPFVRMAADAMGGGLLAWATSRFYSRKAGDAVWLGCIVNVAHTLLKQFLGNTAFGRSIGLSGLGDDLADRMRDAVAQRVQNDLRGLGNGLGTYLTAPQTRLGEYVTEGQLRTGSEYSPGGGGLREYDVRNQETGF